MISAFAGAGEVLGRAALPAVARQAVDFVLRHAWRDGRLLSTYKDGTAKLNGYLDDYAFLAAALLDLFEASQDALTSIAPSSSCRCSTSTSGIRTPAASSSPATTTRQLIVRTKPAFDGSIPSGNSVAAHTLLRLHHLTGEALYLERAEAVLQLFYASMRQQPFGFANMLGALDLETRGAVEIVIVGPRDDDATKRDPARCAPAIPAEPRAASRRPEERPPSPRATGQGAVGRPRDDLRVPKHDLLAAGDLLA